jgi:hypothetical protein
MKHQSLSFWFLIYVGWAAVRIYKSHLHSKTRAQAKALVHQPANSKSEIVKIADTVTALGLRCILMLAYQVDSHRWYRDR